MLSRFLILSFSYDLWISLCFCKLSFLISSSSWAFSNALKRIFVFVPSFFSSSSFYYDSFNLYTIILLSILYFSSSSSFSYLTLLFKFKFVDNLSNSYFNAVLSINRLLYCTSNDAFDFDRSSKFLDKESSSNLKLYILSSLSFFISSIETTSFCKVIKWSKRSLYFY
jgi:hypothetical protein